MALALTSGHDPSVQLHISSQKGALVQIRKRGSSFWAGANTGVIAAAAGANSTFFYMATPIHVPAPSWVRVKSIELQFACSTAFTTPITAGRRLCLYRVLGGGPAAGGTSISTSLPADPNLRGSYCDSFNGGDIRISTTTGLTTTGISFESQEFATLLLVGQGTAGAYKRQLYDFTAAHANPLVLNAGQGIAIRNPVAMDAAGVWGLNVTVEYEEGPAFDSLP